MKFVYCDYIAFLIKDALKKDTAYVQKVGDVVFNLGAYGELRDTQKMLFVTDKFGTKYQVTVEEIP